MCTRRKRAAPLVNGRRSVSHGLLVKIIKRLTVRYCRYSVPERVLMTHIFRNKFLRTSFEINSRTRHNARYVLRTKLDHGGHLKVGSRKFERVRNLKYSDATINGTSNDREKIKTRRTVADKRRHGPANVSESKQVSLKLKITLYRVVISDQSFFTRVRDAADEQRR